VDLSLRFSSHPSEEILEAYALHRLPEEQIPEVEMHLLACEACQRSLADVDGFIASLKAVSGGTPPLSKPFPYWQAALAAAVLLVGAFFLWDSGASVVPATIVLTSLRGSETASQTGPANVPLELNIASSEVDDTAGFRIEVVTQAGEPAWSGPVTRSAEGKPLASVDKRLSAGPYWVRLYGPDDQLLQEYGLVLN
jgi:hypothetical protein